MPGNLEKKDTGYDQANFSVTDLSKVDEKSELSSDNGVVRSLIKYIEMEFIQGGDRKSHIRRLEWRVRAGEVLSKQVREGGKSEDFHRVLPLFQATLNDYRNRLEAFKPISSPLCNQVESQRLKFPNVFEQTEYWVFNYFLPNLKKLEDTSRAITETEFTHDLDGLVNENMKTAEMSYLDCLTLIGKLEELNPLNPDILFLKEVISEVEKIADSYEKIIEFFQDLKRQLKTDISARVDYDELNLPDSKDLCVSEDIARKWGFDLQDFDKSGLEELGREHKPPAEIIQWKSKIREKLAKALFPVIMIGGVLLNSYFLKLISDKTEGFSSWPSPKTTSVASINPGERNVRSVSRDKAISNPISWKQRLASDKYDLLDSSNPELIGRFLYADKGENFKDKLLEDFSSYIEKFIFPRIGKEKAAVLVAHAGNLWQSKSINDDFEFSLSNRVKYDPEAGKVGANMNKTKFVDVVKSWADAASGKDKVTAVALKGKSVSGTIAYLMQLRLPEYSEQDIIDFVRTGPGLRAFKSAVDSDMWRPVSENTKFDANLERIDEPFLNWRRKEEEKVKPKRQEFDPGALIARRSPIIKKAREGRIGSKVASIVKFKSADYYDGGSKGKPEIFFASRINEAGEAEIDLNGLDRCLPGILTQLILLSLDGEKGRESVYNYLVDNERWLSGALLKKPYFNEETNTLVINKSIISSLAKEAKRLVEFEKDILSPGEFFGSASSYMKKRVPGVEEVASLPAKKGFFKRTAGKVKSFFGKKKNQPEPEIAPKQSFAKVYIPEGVDPREFLNDRIKFSISERDLAGMRGTPEYYRAMKEKQEMEKIKDQALQGSVVEVPLGDYMRVVNVA